MKSPLKVAVTGAAGQIGYSLLFRIASGSMLGVGFAMTRLDENRAKSQLAAKAGTHVSSVSNLAIWGNHSSTQYLDFYNAKIDGKPVTEVIKDEPWLKETFIPIVQQRGAAIIKAGEHLRRPPRPTPQSTRFGRWSIPLLQAIGTASLFVRTGATESKKV